MFGALGALANSPRKWHKLRGYVQRIAAMQRVVADVHEASEELAVHGADEALNPALPPDLSAATERGSRGSKDMRRSGSRVASDAEEIAFEKVTVVTPANTVLVRDLSVRVPAGTNLLVTGPNGAGKSSLFRVLGGLWPAESGVVRKPDAAEAGLSHHIFYVPQRPYVVKGAPAASAVYFHGMSERDVTAGPEQPEPSHRRREGVYINWAGDALHAFWRQYLVHRHHPWTVDVYFGRGQASWQCLVRVAFRWMGKHHTQYVPCQCVAGSHRAAVGLSHGRVFPEIRPFSLRW